MGSFEEWAARGKPRKITVEVCGPNMHRLAIGQPVVLLHVDREGEAHILAYPGNRHGWLKRDEWRFKDGKAGNNVNRRL